MCSLAMTMTHKTDLPICICPFCIMLIYKRQTGPPITRQNSHMQQKARTGNQRTIGPENAHLKPDLGVLSHNEMTLTLNTHTPLLTS